MGSMNYPARIILLTQLLGTLCTAAPTKLNILIIYADDMGYGDLAIHNKDSKIPTPNLDALARSGMRFTDGHSSSGICTPSRYALLTGRHHWRDFHGIVGALGGSIFKPERLTLPEMLKAEGYDTAAIGKWHLGWDWDAIRKPDTPKKSHQHTDFDWTKPIPDGPLAHGFDYYFGDTVINFPPYAWIENDKMVKAPDSMMDTKKWKPIKEGNWECRPGPMITGWDPYENIPTTTAKAVEFLIDPKRGEKPYFLYFALPAPHAPIIPNDKFDGKSKAGAYGDFVYEIDHACGQLLEAVKKSGGADRTIVIFSADNGPEHYAYARDEKFDHWSAKPFRGLKRDIYEGGHHVPFIVRWPGKTKAGSTCEALVSQVDLMGTIAAAIGHELPKENAAEDSHNLLPLLEGGSDPVRTSHVHNTYAKQWAVRDGDWVLIDAKNGYRSKVGKGWEKKHGYPADDTGATELYHLKNDISQRHNVAKDYPKKVAELQKLLNEIRSSKRSAP
jgi:arylsulfatase A